MTDQLSWADVAVAIEQRGRVHRELQVARERTLQVLSGIIHKAQSKKQLLQELDAIYVVATTYGKNVKYDDSRWLIVNQGGELVLITPPTDSGLAAYGGGGMNHTVINEARLSEMISVFKCTEKSLFASQQQELARLSSYPVPREVQYYSQK